MILKILGYILLFLVVTFLIYWHKLYTREKKIQQIYSINIAFQESLLYFIIGIIYTPISFILGVYGIKTKSYPDGP
tara:strand:- start:621 stop:848 length:228 start_codon:yes stop_codon:yes gene_type:complete